MSDAVRGALYPGQGSSIVASTTVEGGGGGSIAVQESGTPIVAAATTLNFVGATVTDAGGGEATITISGGSSGVAVAEGGDTIVADATKLNFVGATVTDAGGGEATVTITAGSFPDITDTPGVSVVVAATTDGLIANAPAATNPGLTVQFADSGSDGDALFSAFSTFGGGIAVSKDTSSGGFGYNIVTIIEMVLAGNIAFGAIGELTASGTVNDYEVGPTGPLAFNPGGGGLTVTGMVPVNANSQPIYGVGALRIILNAGTGTVTLENQNAGSSALNRFTLPSATNVVIPAGGCVLLYYSPPSSPVAASTWLMLAKSF